MGSLGGVALGFGFFLIRAVAWSSLHEFPIHMLGNVIDHLGPLVPKISFRLYPGTQYRGSQTTRIKLRRETGGPTCRSASRPPIAWQVINYA